MDAFGVKKDIIEINFSCLLTFFVVTTRPVQVSHDPGVFPPSAMVIPHGNKWLTCLSSSEALASCSLYLWCPNTVPRKKEEPNTC